MTPLLSLSPLSHHNERGRAYLGRLDRFDFFFRKLLQDGSFSGVVEAQDEDSGLHKRRTRRVIQVLGKRGGYRWFEVVSSRGIIDSWNTQSKFINIFY